MNKYGPKAQETIEKTVKKYKAGTLRQGSSDETVKSRKQAIAIGIAEAKRKGYKAPTANKLS